MACTLLLCPSNRVHVSNAYIRVGITVEWTALTFVDVCGSLCLISFFYQASERLWRFEMNLCFTSSSYMAPRYFIIITFSIFTLYTVMLQVPPTLFITVTFAFQVSFSFCHYFMQDLHISFCIHFLHPFHTDRLIRIHDPD